MIIFWRLYTCNIYIILARASDVEQLYKTFIQKNNNLSQQQVHIWQRFLTIHVKNIYELPSVCMLYIIKNKSLTFS